MARNKADSFPSAATEESASTAPSGVARYAMAVLCMLVALTMSLSLQPVLGGVAPFIFFVGASMLAGWYGGIGPGLLALLSGFLLGDFFFLKPIYQLGAYSLFERILLLGYASLAAIGLAVTTQLHRIKSRASGIHRVAIQLEREIGERRQVEEALLASKEKLNFALAAAGMCSWNLDISNCDFEWTPGCESILGTKRNGRPEGYKEFLGYVHPEDREPLKRSLRECIRQRTDFQQEFRVIWANGSLHWILAKGRVLHENNGKPTRIYGVIMEITERKRARDELAYSEQFIRSTLNALEDHIAILDERGTILKVNQAWQDFAVANHLTMTDFGVGSNYLSICDRSQAAGNENGGQAAAGIRAVASSQLNHFDMEYSCHSRMQQRWFIMRVTRFHGNGTPRLVVSHENVTELKKAEEALRQSEERAKAQYKGFPIPTYTWQMTSKGFVLIDCNDAAHTFTNGRIIDLMGKTAADLFPDTPEIIDEIAGCFGRRQPIHREMTYKLRSTGETKRLSVTYVHVPPDLIMVHCEDISERKRAEEELQKTLSLFRTTLESTTTGILVVDLADKVVSYNQRFATMWQIPETVLAATNDAKLQEYVLNQLAEPEMFMQGVRELLENPGAESQDELHFKDGRVFERYSQPHRMGNQIVGRVWSFNDVTDRERTEAALRLSEERFRTAFAGAAVGMSLRNLEGRFVEVNSAFCSILGYAKEELVGRSAYSIVHPPDIPKIQELTKRLLAGEIPNFIVEKRYVARGGDIVWVQSSASLLRDAQGGPAGILAISEDISERKRAEEALRQSEERYHGLADATFDAVLIHENGRALEVNRSLCEMFGYEPDELLGRENVLKLLVAPDSQETALAHMRAKSEEPYEVRVRNKENKTFLVELRTRNLTYRGRPARVVSAHDITGRKQMEEALRESEARFRELADAMPQIVWTLRPDGTREYVNKKWLEYSGLPMEPSTTSEGWELMLHPDDKKYAMEAMRAALETGHPLQIAARFKHRDGSYRWHLTRALAVRNESGGIARWFATSTDIEDQKRIEHDLQTAREQLAEYAQDLERRVAERTAKLEVSIRSLEGVLYHVAHDLRAPLRAMAGFSEILMEHSASGLDEEGRGYAERIINGAKRMDSLIKDLLAYGRLSHMQISPRQVDVGGSVQQVLLRLAAAIRVRHAEVQITKPLPAVLADATILDEVLTQLVQNALKFMSPGITPRIQIRAERRDAMVRLWVEDNGIGIDTEHWERIFHVFQRLHGQEEYSGTGIGLAIVQKGVERMGGLVGVESKPDAGSRFWIELPAV